MQSYVVTNISEEEIFFIFRVEASQGGGLSSHQRNVCKHPQDSMVSQFKDSSQYNIVNFGKKGFMEQT
jgi:hypothetical protein